jgi:hypothetical protein
MHCARFVALFVLLSAPAFAQTACEQRLPGTPQMDNSAVNLRMSLEDADRLLTYKGYKQLVPRGDDLGFVYARTRDKRHNVVIVASFTVARCVDYVASKSEFVDARNVRTASAAQRMRSDDRGPNSIRWLSRFQDFAAFLVHRPESPCTASFHTDLSGSSLTESINLCALTGAADAR